MHELDDVIFIDEETLTQEELEELLNGTSEG